MRRLLASFDRFVPLTLAEPGKRQRGQMVVLFSAVGAASMLGFAIAGSSLGIPTGAIIAFFAIALGHASVPFVVKLTQSIWLATQVFTFMWMMGAVVGMWVRGGVDNPAVMVLAPMPLIAMVLGGRRTGFSWFVIALLLLSTVAIAPDLGLTFRDQIASGDRVSYAVATVVMTLLSLGLLALSFTALEAMSDDSLRSATARTRAAENEAQMLRAGRLAALGEVASSLAHEINNPLMYVMANLEFLIDDMELPESAKEACVDAHEGTHRIAAIVKDLRAYASSDDQSIEPVDLAVVANSTARLVGGYVRKRARLVLDLSSCPPTDGNWSQLGQVVINLVVNATQSIDSGPASENEVRIRTGVDGELAYLEVSDTGRGIKADDLAKVTEPFFTTEHGGGGTGLGLSVTKNIVDRLGGLLDIESTVGVGTTVRISLELAAKNDDRDRRITVPVDVSLKIVLVDAEPLMAAALSRMLADHDFCTVENITDVETRIAKGDMPDLIMLDSHRGMEVSWKWFEQMEKNNPELSKRVIFLVGGTDRLDSQPVLSRCSERVVMKPIGRERLVEILDQFLPSGRKGGLAQ